MTTDLDSIASGLNVSRETLDDLVMFQRLVEKWNPTINLVSKSDLSDLWNRHIVDSVQIFGLMPSNTETWCDIGSGGGFPGLVIAILAKERCPSLKVVLIESDKRKSVFLRQAAHDLKLNVKVLSERIGEAEPQKADVVSARALASLSALCGFANRHMLPSGLAIFPKGANAAAEIEEARLDWDFELSSSQSVTEAGASILILREITHV